MRKLMNAAAGYATAVVMAIFMVASVLVFTSCDTGNEDDLHYSVGCTDCDDPNTNPDPEKTVVRVDHINGDCPVQNIEWSSKNATLTRGEEYTVAAADRYHTPGQSRKEPCRPRLHRLEFPRYCNNCVRRSRH